MMDLALPAYSLQYLRPVIGYGNFSGDIRNSREMVADASVIGRKLALWDRVLAEKLLESDDRRIRSEALSLLEDKSIFAYNFMRLNGKPVRTRWAQDIVLSDRHDRILFCGCNQVLGKSTALDIDASTSFLRDHGSGWLGLLVSGSLAQSQKRMSNIKLLLDSMENIQYQTKDIDYDDKGKSNATMLSYYYLDERTKRPIYANELICCPFTSSALGYPANDVWLDELDFWEDVKGGQQHFLNQVIFTRVLQTRGRIICYSNPNGREGVMHWLWEQVDKLGFPVWHRYQFNFWDKPDPTQDEFDKAAIGKTRFENDSTLLAAFSRGEGSFFSAEEIAEMLDQQLAQKGDAAGYGRETAWFLDIGTVHDQSFLAGAFLDQNPLIQEIPLIKLFWLHKYPVGYPLGRVVGIEEKDDDGWKDYADDNQSVKWVLNEYAEEIGGKRMQPLFGFDATGNKGMVPLFSAAGIDAMDVTFSGPLKWSMYQRFQYYVQQRFIKRAKERDQNTVRECDFDNQMRKLTVKKGTRTRYKQIHHENENDLDDACDAVVGLIHLIENPDVPSLSYDIINKGKSVLDENGNLKKDDAKKDNDGKDVLEGQYIPSWMGKDEQRNWMERRRALEEGDMR